MPGLPDPQPTPAVLGYLSPGYRDSFRWFGPVSTLPRSGLHVLHRSLPDGRFDLTGLYPYSACTDWAGLAEDLETLKHRGAVSLALVSDPFAADAAHAAFDGWALAQPFKTHWVVDLTGDWRARRSRNTRYYAAKGCAAQEVFIAPDPVAEAGTFWALYAAAGDRLKMGALQRLTSEIIADQLALADSILIVARTDTGVTGMMMTMINGTTAYLHIMGMTEEATTLYTSYALFHTALEHLETCGCARVSLGGGAGLTDDPGDGLYQFKKRWASEACQTLFGGAILDGSTYRQLVAQSGTDSATFFPAYRTPGSPLAWTPEVTGPNTAEFIQ